MTAQHTPGPWTLEDGGFIIADGTSPEGLTAVATVQGGPIHLDWDASDENVANAILIAAAPELLAALTRIADKRMDETTDDAQLAAFCLMTARAAIAAATKETER